MTAPHRGLPPPMPLLSPAAPSSLVQLIDNCKTSDESLRSWLGAKMEEDRRLSEEERTKQEALRLDVRRTELEMMREAMRGGMNPSLVPFMFAGSVGISTRTADFIKDQMAEFVTQHSQTQQLFPGQELRRETRSIANIQRQGGYDSVPKSQQQGQGQIMAPPVGAPRDAPYTQQPYNPPLAITAPPRVSSQQALQQPFSAQQQQQPAPAPSQQQVYQPGRPRGATLPPLSTTEHHQQPFQVAPQQPAQQPPPQYPPPTTSETTPATQAPFIFFHHYVPPGQQGSSSSGHTRSSPPRHLDSPFSHHHSHVTGPESASSPKKRKSTSTQPQQPPPPNPTSQSQSFSPIFSNVSSASSRRTRGHSRPRSDSTSAIGQDRYSRSQPSRQRRSDGGYAPIDGGPSHSDLPPTSVPPGHEHSAPPPQMHPQPQYQDHQGSQHHQQLPPMHPHSRPPSDPGTQLPPPRPQSEYSQSRLQSPGSDIRRSSHPYPQAEEQHPHQRGRIGSGGSQGEEQPHAR